MSTRGFFAIGVWHPKTKVNIGTLIRTAHIYGASLCFTIGRRYRKQASAVKLDRHIPVLHFDTTEQWRQAMPANARLVAVEMSDEATPLAEYKHPERAIYLLGAEDHGLRADMMQGCEIVQLPGERSVNVAVAGSIVLYDRWTKGLVT